MRGNNLSINGRKINITEIADLIGGEIRDLAGELYVSGVASILDAQPSDLTFLLGAKNYPLHIKNLSETKALAVVAPLDAPDLPLTSIRVKNPYFALQKLLATFYPVVKPEYRIHPSSFVHEDAQVDETTIIGPMAVIEKGAVVAPGAWIESNAYIGTNAKIGDNTRIYPGVRILADSIVGKNCIIHSNTVIGSDGFGFTCVDDVHLKIMQIGNVVIGNDVEIGACVTIDRATMGSTVVGDGTKIDNMVHLAHNVVVGKNCIIVAQVGVSGSTIIEDSVTLAGQVGTVGHVRIGKGTTVAARGVVTNDVAPGVIVSGFPIKPHAEERKILASLRRLPDLIKKVRNIEIKLGDK